MRGMFFAELAILIHFESFGIVLFVFESIVISLFAFRTRQSYLSSIAFCSHNAPSEYEKINTPLEMLIYFNIYIKLCQGILIPF